MISESDPYKLHTLIEAFLFWKGEPVTISDISKALGIEKDSVQRALTEMLHIDEHIEKSRGIVLIAYDDMYTLGTHPDAGDVIARLTKEELQKELSKSALETLAIILYQGPVRRSDIDYIRGVNSQFILRNLVLRGLIQRNTDPKDERTFVYTPSLELLAHLGVQHIQELPDFEQVTKTLYAFNTEQVES